MLESIPGPQKYVNIIASLALFWRFGALVLDTLGVQVEPIQNAWTMS